MSTPDSPGPGLSAYAREVIGVDGPAIYPASLIHAVNIPPRGRGDVGVAAVEQAVAHGVIAGHEGDSPRL